MKIFGIEIKLGQGSQKERRSAPREKVFETVYVDYTNPELQIKGTGEVKDLTPQGVCFGSFMTLSEGMSVDLVLRFTPGSIRTNTLKIRGRVVRCQKMGKKNWYNLNYGHEIACAFSELEGEARHELQAFMDWLKQYKEKYLHFRWGSERERD